jgi:translation initiation factor 2 alpha subunit (eIF-2alpha)
MDLTCNFYDREFPIVGEIVTILMSEPKDDIISSKILEYPKLSGVMQVADLTSKKRIRSVRQYLHKKPVPAEVTEIDEHTKMISLTRKYLKSTEGLYQRFYQEKNSFLNIVKNFVRENPELDIDELVKTIIHPTMDLLDDYKEDETKPPVVFSTLENLFNEDNLPDYGKYTDRVKSAFEKLFAEKPSKHVTKFSLMCSVSVENIIELFRELAVKYPKVKFTLESSPEYTFETFGIESEERENHKKIIEFIKSVCKGKRITSKFLD